MLLGLQSVNHHGHGYMLISSMRESPPDDRIERPCGYGSLPGRWVGSLGVLGPEQLEAASPQWQTFDAHCQLSPLLDPIVTSAAGKCGEAGGGSNRDDSRPRILMLGDSVDRTILHDVCHAAEGLDTEKRSEKETACMENWAGRYDAWCCSLPGLQLSTLPYWGVSPVGPYNKNQTGNAESKFDQALTEFPRAFGTSPDMVVVGALLWDLARWKTIDPDGIMQTDQIPPPLLDTWIADMDSLLTLLRVTVPESTLLAVHTLHFPRLREGPHINGQFEHRTITRWAHVAQLNAAMRHLAAKHRLQVIDMEAMTAQYHEGRLFLRDNTHPAPWFSREVANVILNIAAEARTAR